jgi:hypothetical protein
MDALMPLSAGFATAKKPHKENQISIVKQVMMIQLRPLMAVHHKTG